MAFQFPPNPIVGQEYDPSAGIKFRWNGTAWFLINPITIQSVDQSDTPPPDFVKGDLWFESDTGAFYLSYTNPDATITIVGLNGVGGAFIPAGEKAAVNGVASLGADGKVPTAQLPSATTQQVFTVAGAATYTAPAGLRFAKVTVVGAGGAGCGVPDPAGGFSHAGGGGGAGGTAINWFTAAQIGPSQAVTVGAGGVGSATQGTAGGATNFGALLQATGGDFGKAGGLGAPTSNARGAVGGVGSGSGASLIAIVGGPGQSSSTQVNAIFHPGSGGNSTHGGGGVGAISGNGGVGGNYGGGGGGTTVNATGGAFLGGNGASGLVIVEEFY